MAKTPKKIEPEDEPGAEDRFMRGITKALNTPPKPFTPAKKNKPKKAKSSASAQRSRES